MLVASIVASMLHSKCIGYLSREFLAREERIRYISVIYLKNMKNTRGISYECGA